MKYLRLSVIGWSLLALIGCTTAYQSADSKQAQLQEKSLAEGDAEVPQASIVNWNEKRMAKYIQEIRDKKEYQTWTYKFNMMDGKYTFVCDSLGYGLPYNTRTNNPEHYEFVTTQSGATMSGGGGGYYTTQEGTTVWGEHHVMPQAEPNGLFIPDSAKGTWNVCKDPTPGPTTASRLSPIRKRISQSSRIGYRNKWSMAGQGTKRQPNNSNFRHASARSTANLIILEGG